MKPRAMTPEDAAKLIYDGATIAAATVAFTGHAESVLKHIEKRFLETGHPRDLTFTHAAGSQGPNKNGSIHMCHEGMTKRYIAAHWGVSKEWCDLVESNKVEAFSFSQGTITHMFRSNGSGQPGHITKTGLGTFIDPRQDGGKMNRRTKENAPDLVQLLEIDGEEYLFYKAFPIHFALIRATYADEDGNLTMDEEPVKLETLPVVLAAKRYGGTVIVQVKKIVKNGSLDPRNVVIPGNFVDCVVECEDPINEHRMTAGSYYDPAFLGRIRYTDDRLPGIPVEMNMRKIIGRRAAMEAKKGDIGNVGVGIPYDTVSRLMYEEGIRKDVTFTLEMGVFGGVLTDVHNFGAAYNFEAMIDQPAIFDFYNGAGLDITFMGAGEIDAAGNVNASKMNGKVTGCGGFVDITQHSKKVVFCLTFTARGLREAWSEQEGIQILQEGQNKKFVRQLLQTTFSAEYARKAGQQVVYVTDRAVFVLTEKGIMLTEIARGVDLQRDILDQMEFIPEISKNLREIPTVIYREGLMGLKEILGCEE